jgi:hypothetical protein
VKFDPSFLDTFCVALGTLVNTHKIDHWILGLDCHCLVPYSSKIYSHISRYYLWDWVIPGLYVELVPTNATK